MKFLVPFLKCIPLLSVLALIMGGSSVWIGGYPVLPALYLIPVYYWVVFCPQWLPLGSLLGIGLFYDSLMGNELGISSVLLMISGFLSQYARPFLNSYSFPLIWATFGLYSFLFLFLYGLLMGGGVSFGVSWFYGTALYPLFAWILSHLHRRLRSYV